MSRFDGKSILVTGASSGIGKATAQRFAREGARVLIFADRAAELAQAAADMRAEGLDVVDCHGDVSVAADVQRAVDQAIQAFGRIDVLVSNAGLAYLEPLVQMSEAHWDRLMAVNLKGMFLFGQKVAQHMLERQGGGVILFTASVNGHAAETGLAAYNASKGGIVLLMKTMALELGPSGIRVNAVSPGFIDTPITHDYIVNDPRWNDYVRSIAWGRAGRPDEVAAAFAWLASDDAEYITGLSLIIDGGQIAALTEPGIQDRRQRRQG